MHKNPDIHCTSTRHRYYQHVPSANLRKYQDGVYYTGIKLFKSLPPAIWSL